MNPPTEPPPLTVGTRVRVKPLDKLPAEIRNAAGSVSHISDIGGCVYPISLKFDVIPDGCQRLFATFGSFRSEELETI
jgi:hypothetical protein